MSHDDRQVIPLTSLLAGDRIDLGEVWRSAREAPALFMLELFQIAMIILGIVTVGGWAYELGYWLGFNG